jgi:MFS family permease
MTKKQFFALFLGNLVPYIVGAGALPLLPVYATKLGAPPAVTGYYLAFAYLALTAGTLVAGWLSGRFGRRRTWLALAGAVGVPVTWAVGRATNVWALSALTAGLWFLGGIGVTLTSILAGLSANPDERGKVFGFLALAAGLGGTIGALVTGPLVDRGGYPAMFAVLAAVMALWLVAAFLVEDKERAAPETGAGSEPAPAGRAPLGKPFYLLCAAYLLASIAQFVHGMDTSLSMDGLGFAATAISITAAIGAAVTTPLPLLLGWLSDRGGRKQLLILCYLALAVSMLLLIPASSLWQFGLAVTLRSLAISISSCLGQALAVDLLPTHALSRGLSLFGTTAWVGAVIGFIGTGHAMEQLGLASTLVGSALLSLAAIALLVPMRQARQLAPA